MEPQPAPGLREQKRAATRRALQVALLELSIERGFANVTVEDVGRAAQVSPRTFFNYFATKEDAVTGTHEPFAPTEEQVQRFLEGDGDVLEDLIALLAENAAEVDDAVVHGLRRRLMQENPALLGARLANAKRFEEEVVVLAERRLERSATPAPGAPTAPEQARLVTHVAAAVARHGWERWAAAGGERPLGACLLDAYAAFRLVCAPATRRDTEPAEALG